MAFEFKLPEIGEGMHEAELLQWMVKEGEVVREDDPLMEVQTDKTAVEITSPVKGKVIKLLGKPGDVLKMGSVVVHFDDVQKEGAPAKAPAEAPAEALAEARESAAAPLLAAADGFGASPAGRSLAAPATRKLAREMAVDISQVPGSGPAGRVTPADLRQFKEGARPAAGSAAAGATPAAPNAPAAPAAAIGTPPLSGVAPYVATGPAANDERFPLKGIRKVISERMVKSKQTAAHVTTVDEVEMTELSAFRARAKELAVQKGLKLSYMPFIVKALTVALREFPYMNAQVDDEKQEIVLRRQYHLGYALDTEAGLLVPVIRDADRKSIFQIAAEMQDQAARGRVGKLSPDELKGSTFTLSNQGSIGGLFFTPVINYPEVAILGVGQTQERPVVRDGEVVVRKMAYLALSFDHRLIDGGLATRFLSRVAALLGNPALLMMEAM